MPAEWRIGHTHFFAADPYAILVSAIDLPDERTWHIEGEPCCATSCLTHSPHKMIEHTGQHVVKAFQRFCVRLDALQRVRIFPTPHHCSRADIAQFLYPDELINQREGIADNRIDSIVKRVRRKIEVDPDHPHYILTIRGFGFRLADGHHQQYATSSVP